jgi:hypothetical protein
LSKAWLGWAWGGGMKRDRRQGSGVPDGHSCRLLLFCCRVVWCGTAFWVVTALIVQGHHDLLKVICAVCWPDEQVVNISPGLIRRTSVASNDTFQ